MPYPQFHACSLLTWTYVLLNLLSLTVCLLLVHSVWFQDSFRPTRLSYPPTPFHTLFPLLCHYSSFQSAPVLFTKTVMGVKGHMDSGCEKRLAGKRLHRVVLWSTDGLSVFYSFSSALGSLWGSQEPDVWLVKACHSRLIWSWQRRNNRQPADSISHTDEDPLSPSWPLSMSLCPAEAGGRWKAVFLESGSLLVLKRPDTWHKWRRDEWNHWC